MRCDSFFERLEDRRLFAATASIRGFVFNDLNTNGHRDSGERCTSIRVAERGPGGIGATLRVRACRPSLPSGVVEDSTDVVEHLTHDDAAEDS